MKNNKVIAVLLIMIVACAIFTGCSWFGGGDDSSNPFAKKVDVNFHNGDSVSTETITVGKEHTATVPVKNGYYMVGYFTQPEGGEKYFDECGRSLSVWSKDYPTDFYAQWASISGLKLYDINEQGETREYSYNGLSPTVQIVYTLEEFPKIALKGNLNKQVSVKISYRIKETDGNTDEWYFRVYDGTGSSAEIIYAADYEKQHGDYVTQNIAFTCEARLLNSGKICVLISSDYSFAKFYIKDFTMTVEFV